MKEVRFTIEGEKFLFQMTEKRSLLVQVCEPITATTRNIYLPRKAIKKLRVFLNSIKKKR